MSEQEKSGPRASLEQALELDRAFRGLSIGIIKLRQNETKDRQLRKYPDIYTQRQRMDLIFNNLVRIARLKVDELMFGPTPELESETNEVVLEFDGQEVVFSEAEHNHHQLDIARVLPQYSGELLTSTGVLNDTDFYADGTFTKRQNAFKRNIVLLKRDLVHPDGRKALSVYKSRGLVAYGFNFDFKVDGQDVLRTADDAIREFLRDSYANNPTDPIRSRTSKAAEKLPQFKPKSKEGDIRIDGEQLSRTTKNIGSSGRYILEYLAQLAPAGTFLTSDLYGAFETLAPGERRYTVRNMFSAVRTIFLSADKEPVIGVIQGSPANLYYIRKDFWIGDVLVRKAENLEELERLAIESRLPQVERVKLAINKPEVPPPEIRQGEFIHVLDSLDKTGIRQSVEDILTEDTKQRIRLKTDRRVDDRLLSPKARQYAAAFVGYWQEETLNNDLPLYRGLHSRLFQDSYPDGITVRQLCEFEGRSPHDVASTIIDILKKSDDPYIEAFLKELNRIS